MKLKYYLRGLGIGIIITVIIMTVSFSGRKETLTNEQIIEEAKKLGMVMQEEEKTDSLKEEEEGSKNEETDSEDQEQDVKNEEEPDVPDDTPEQNEEDQQPEEETIHTIEIVQGEVSADLCRKLLEAGLISDIDSFNQYLIDFDLDHELHVGSYQIPEGATELEIIAILGVQP